MQKEFGENTMKTIPVILDGDPGHDDAIAWVFAKAEPMLDIRAVISVAGNQTIEKTTINAINTYIFLSKNANEYFFIT